MSLYIQNRGIVGLPVRDESAASRCPATRCLFPSTRLWWTFFFQRMRARGGGCLVIGGLIACRALDFRSLLVLDCQSASLWSLGCEDSVSSTAKGR